MEGGRKRMRSQDNDVVQQRKYFINQKIVDQNDKLIMEKIYKKTLSMMYNGQNKIHNKSVSNSSHESSMGAEEIDTVDDKLTQHNQGCKFCLNEIDASGASSSCSNCNLIACERCKTFCIYCSNSLCLNCVNLFGCSLTNVDDSVLPICEDCKKFVD